MDWQTIAVIATLVSTVTGLVALTELFVSKRRAGTEKTRESFAVEGSQTESGDGGDTETVFLSSLPPTSPDLFGRDADLAALDSAWESPHTNVVSIIGLGGIGKTAIVTVWLNRMGLDGYRGAERVYGWSSYTQGAAAGTQTSADAFLAAALKWFGDTNPDEGSPPDKGLRLARLVRKHRTLLVLDGLEPLQYPPGERTGQLKDSGLRSLLRELARHNAGLCVLTSKLAIDGLKDFAGSQTLGIELESLSRESGIDLLRSLGVGGESDELGQAVHEYEGHALALTLLGRYLATVYRGDIRQREHIPSLPKIRKVAEGEGLHARRIMESYEAWFDGRIELSAIRLMGLFDRPVDERAFETLIAEPGIEGLTAPKRSLLVRVARPRIGPSSAWTTLSHADRQVALSNLRAVGLLAEPDPSDPNTLETHPLVRKILWREAQGGKPRRLAESPRAPIQVLPVCAREGVSRHYRGNGTTFCRNPPRLRG